MQALGSCSLENLEFNENLLCFVSDRISFSFISLPALLNDLKQSTAVKCGLSFVILASSCETADYSNLFKM